VNITLPQNVAKTEVNAGSLNTVCAFLYLHIVELVVCCVVINTGKHDCFINGMHEETTVICYEIL
jgi:hypothetical protein